MCAAGSHLVDEEVWFPEHVRRNRNLGNSTKLIGVPWDAFIFPNLQPIKGELPGKIIFEINRALVSTVIRKCCFSIVRMKATKIYSPSSPRWREWKSVFSQSGNKHTHTHIRAGHSAWQRSGDESHTNTVISTHHSQDGIEDDVQLYNGGLCVVQNGPGHFEHTVFFGEVQVVQDVLVAAHFLRRSSSYCT